MSDDKQRLEDIVDELNEKIYILTAELKDAKHTNVVLNEDYYRLSGELKDKLSAKEAECERLKDALASAIIDLSVTYNVLTREDLLTVSIGQWARPGKMKELMAETGKGGQQNDE